MLTIIEYLEDFQFYQQFNSLWAAFQEKFTNFLSPTKKSHSQIQAILNHHQEAQELYNAVLHGRCAAALLSELESLAKDEKAPKEKRGQACLVLSKLFQEDVAVENFKLAKNLDRAQSEGQLAVKLLGRKAKLSPQSRQSLEKLRAGGEPAFAFQRLHNIAKLDLSASACFAKKALSFIYEHGARNQSFIVWPDQQLAQSYLQRATSGFGEIKQVISAFLDKISKFFITPRTNDLLRGLAGIDDKAAQYRYAQILERERKNPKEFISWYQKAAQRSEDSPLALERKGYYPAMQYMVEAHDKERYGLKSQEASHYRVQVLLSGEKDSEDGVANLRKQAAAGDSTSNLQLAWHSLENIPEQEAALQVAAGYIKVAEAGRKKWQEYQHQLYEELCLTVARAYESLHLGSGASESQTESLAKAIQYYQKIPPSSEYYSEVRFQIAHHQQYIMKDESGAINSLVESGSDSTMSNVIRAINLAFNKYCKTHNNLNLTAEQKVILESHKAENIFWGTSDQIPSLNNEKPFAILTKIVNRLQLINEQRKSAKKSPLLNLVNLKKALDDYLKHGDKISITDLPQTLQSAIRAKLTRSLRPNTEFFAKSATPDNRISLVLNAMLHLLEKFAEQTKNLPQNAYREIKANQYFDFVIQVCNDFVINVQQNHVDNPITILSLKQGSAH